MRLPASHSSDVDLASVAATTPHLMKATLPLKRREGKEGVEQCSGWGKGKGEEKGTYLWGGLCDSSEAILYGVG